MYYVGASHSRVSLKLINDFFSRETNSSRESTRTEMTHVVARYPFDLYRAAFRVMHSKCTHAIVGIGQWPAGWPGGAPMGFDEYKRVVHHGLWFLKAINRHVKILVRSEHENPLGNAISACNPRDWRNPEVIRVYNENFVK